MENTEFMIGRLIGAKGRYQLVKALGKGGGGSVFLGWDRKLKKYWAVKATEPEQGRREAGILRLLSHRGIVVLSDYVEQEGLGYLVMEYVQGDSLQKVLQRDHGTEEAQARAWSMELLEILRYLHRLKPAVYYLDVKPSNIIVMRDNHVKLIDFGSARTEKQAACVTGSRMGTYGYAAPEMWEKRDGFAPDAACDVYGLGMTAYAMVSGFCPEKPPYGMRPPRQWAGRVSPAFAAILLHCCEDEREKRCTDMESLSQEFARMPSGRWLGTRRRPFWRQQKSLFLAGEKGLLLFLTGVFAGGILFAQTAGAAKNAPGGSGTAPLLVSILEQDGKKILLREGSRYPLEGNLMLEIPKEYFDSESSVTVAVRGETETGLREKILLLTPKDKSK